MRIRKIINVGTLFGYKTKFSELANKEMYDCQLGELTFENLGVKRLTVLFVYLLLVSFFLFLAGFRTLENKLQADKRVCTP